MAKTKRKAKAIEPSDPLVPAAELVDENPAATPAKVSPICNIPAERMHGRTKVDISGTEALSIDKHVDKLKYKIAHTAHELADDLCQEASRRNKKDHNYVKGLVWSLGVLFDKLAAGQSEAVSIRIPAKLLDNVKLILAVQAEKKAKTVTVLDTQSNPTPDNSTA